MRYGLINDEKIEATQTGQRAICPCCKTELLSRCGEFKVNHWAHVNLIECDTWKTNKTEWHIWWQDQFPKECQEIIYTDYKTGEKHIADVSYNDFIFEFQHSGIKFEEIVKRTNFYQGIGKKVVWIFDYTDKEDNFNFYHWKLSNVSRIKEWKYKPKHISIMQEWDTLTLIDVGYELRLLLCDSLAIKIDNIKEIVTPEFRTKLFNLQKYFHKDILEKQQKAKAAAQILNNYYDDDNELIELRKELEILKMNQALNKKNNSHLEELRKELEILKMNHNIKEFELENLIKKYDGLQIQYQIILDENNSLKKKISASTNLFSYS